MKNYLSVFCNLREYLSPQDFAVESVKQEVSIPQLLKISGGLSCIGDEPPQTAEEKNKQNKWTESTNVKKFYLKEVGHIKNKYIYRTVPLDNNTFVEILVNFRVQRMEDSPTISL